jgi:hypothetical protein
MHQNQNIKRNEYNNVSQAIYSVIRYMNWMNADDPREVLTDAATDAATDTDAAAATDTDAAAATDTDAAADADHNS